MQHFIWFMARNFNPKSEHASCDCKVNSEDQKKDRVQIYQELLKWQMVMKTFWNTLSLGTICDYDVETNDWTTGSQKPFWHPKKHGRLNWMLIMLFSTGRVWCTMNSFHKVKQLIVFTNLGKFAWGCAKKETSAEGKWGLGSAPWQCTSSFCVAHSWFLHKSPATHQT